MRIEQSRLAAGPQIEAKPGTYALVLYCPRPVRVQIGRLGKMQLRRGYYVYIGSARGPGGLQARVAHHRRLSRRPHWHIDYLRAHTTWRAACFAYGSARRECAWARYLQRMEGAMILLPRFGASDCHCRAHLYYFASMPDLRLGRPSCRQHGSLVVRGGRPSQQWVSS